jgi:DNA-binding Lrp family transcriptional regulator
MTTALDQINAKILKDLLMDGRKSFVQIGKECNTSSDVIAKRYKQMKNKGIIVGATIQNSYDCYNANFVANIIIKIQRGKLDYVSETIAKLPNVLHVYSRTASHNLVAMVILKNIEQLDQVKRSIKGVRCVREVDARVWIGTRSTPENLSVLNAQDPCSITEDKSGKNELNGKKTKSTRVKMDDIDINIVEKLALNGRMPFERIAKPLGVSTDTVVRRYEKLKRNRNLKVVLQINPTKIGYYAYALFDLAFSHETLANPVEYFTGISDINFIIKTSGNFDMTLSLMIKDIHQFTKFQEQIANLSDVTRMEVNVQKLFKVWPMKREFISTF